MATNLSELRAELAEFVRLAKVAESKCFFIEPWQLESVLVGKFMKPQSDPDTTEKDAGLSDDTGELSNGQIEAILMRDRGEMDTQKCKRVE